MSGHGGGESGKVWTVLKVIFIVFIIALVIFWLVTGGVQRAWQAGQHFTNPIALIFGNGSSTGAFITLPWQPEATRGPDISDYVQVADQQQNAADGSGQSADTNTDTSRLQQFGNPSPYQGEVTISGSNQSADAAQEYIQIQAADSNSAPIEVTGWTLQSAVSGKEGFLPQAAPIFQAGVVNAVQPVYLAPGASAIVSTGFSPIGVSFEQNICSGYLGATQSFYPALDSSCPSASDELPETAQNLQTYGASCFDYVNNLESCQLVTSLPSNLSQACRSFLTTTLSYNGCVAMNRSQSNFDSPSWRLYFAMRTSLWNQSHDIVRLLDNSGRVVDVLSY